jgi:glycosyltransferase involved in cell wall biosynthesis
VSVVLPFYNAASTLDEAVRSIRSQTLSEWELLLFDDGSLDESREIANRLAQEDARIRVMSSHHVGFVEALRSCCQEAQGELIARMDADDVSCPERLARQVLLVRDRPDVALCGTSIFPLGKRLGPGRVRYERWLNALTTQEDIVRDLFVECPLAHPTFLMRRAHFSAVGGYVDRGWAEDYDLVMRLWQAGKGLAKVPEPLVGWRDTPSRLSRRDPRYSPRSFRDLKRHYLFSTYLADRTEFHQWGAGEVGKQWLREWGPRAPCGVVDINPRKIGRVIHETPVIAPEELPSPGATFIIVAVGALNARTEIREWFERRGYKELEDYLFVA